MWRLEKDGVVEPVSIAFITSFWYTSSWYTLWLVNNIVTVYFNTYVKHLTLRAQNLTNLYICTAWLSNPPTLHLLKLWHLTYRWHRKWFFRNWRSSAWIEVNVHVFEKMFTGSILLSSCSFSLTQYFTAHLFFSLICTDHEPGTGYTILYSVSHSIIILL